MLLMTKTEAISLYDNGNQLARALRITRSAVSQWRDDKPIPEAREMKLRYQLKPECFDAEGNLRHGKSA